MKRSGYIVTAPTMLTFDPLTLNLELPQMSANDLKSEGAQASVTCTLYMCVVRGAGLGHW